MLRSAKVAATLDAVGVSIPTVEVDFAAVMHRARAVIDTEPGAGAKPLEDLGVLDLAFIEIRTNDESWRSSRRRVPAAQMCLSRGRRCRSAGRGRDG
jgi:hypothetical protein